MKIRIIGDVHGKFHAYLGRIKDAEYSIQLGDFGMAKHWYSLVKHKVDSERHKIVPRGNVPRGTIFLILTPFISIETITNFS